MPYLYNLVAEPRPWPVISVLVITYVVIGINVINIWVTKLSEITESFKQGNIVVEHKKVICSSMSVMNRQNFLEKLFLIFLNDKLARQLKRQVRVARVSSVSSQARLASPVLVAGDRWLVTVRKKDQGRLLPCPPTASTTNQSLMWTEVICQQFISI